MDEIVKNQWLEQDDRRVSESIRRHGCCLEYVMPCDGDQFRTPFCYTIGLFGLGHPELLVYGLDQGSAAGLLNHLYRTVRDGRDPVPYGPQSQPRPGMFSALIDDEGDTGPCSCPCCLM